MERNELRLLLRTARKRLSTVALVTACTVVASCVYTGRYDRRHGGVCPPSSHRSGGVCVHNGDGRGNGRGRGHGHGRGNSH